MISKIKLKSEFGRNVVTLMTGTTVAQAIPVVIAPILTRVYSPEDFGVLALFTSLTAIFGSIANARYELAIMLPQSDEDALNIAALGAAIALGLSLFLMMIFTLFNTTISRAVGNESISLWLYFVPLMVLFIGLFNVLSYFNNRIKNYDDIAKATIYKSLVLSTVQVLLGLLKAGAAGLITGQILSAIFANMKLLKNTLTTTNIRAAVRLVHIKSMAIRYKDFPKYSMWAVLANTMSQDFTNILISMYYSVTTLGFYSLVQRLLGLPTALVGGSIGQVFFQQATLEKQKTGKAVLTFDTTVKKLVFISVPTFTIMFFVVKEVFIFMFGEKWRIAGHYAQILVPFFAIRFVMAAVSNINNVFEKQKIALVWQVILLVIAVGCILVSQTLNLSFENFLVLFSILASVHYLILFFIMRRVSRGA